MEASVIRRYASRRIASHPQRPGFVMGSSKPVVGYLVGRLGAEDGGNLLHGSIHRVPELLVASGGCKRDRRAADTVLICSGVQFDPARMGTRVGRIGRLHLSKAAYCDGNMRIGRSAKLVVEVDIGDFAIKFVLCAVRAAAPARRDLKVESTDQIAVRPRRTTLDEQGSGLQFIHCR